MKAGTLREFKDTTERAYLVEKLRENGWNISKTAEVIGTAPIDRVDVLHGTRVALTVVNGQRAQGEALRPGNGRRGVRIQPAA